MREMYRSCWGLTRTCFLALGMTIVGAVYAQQNPVPRQLSASPIPTADATGIIDTSQVYQQIDGFGASAAFNVDQLMHHPHAADILDALFGPEHGLGADVLRLRNQFRYDHAQPFDPDTAELVRRAEVLRKRPLILMMSSWSPPASLKSNGNANNGGTLIQKDGAYDYAGYAQYWKDSLLAYRAVGVRPAYVAMQNEPDQTTTYESCRFNPSEAPYRGVTYAGYDKAQDAVYKALHTLPAPPLLIGPEVIGVGYGTLQAFMAAMNAEQIVAMTHHLYTGGDKPHPDTYAASLAATKQQYPNLPRWQTEYYTPGGFETALMIHHSLVAEEASMYLYWPFTWPSATGTLLTVEDPAMPAEWKNAQGWSHTGSYYALKHFSYFIHPGYHRVQATSSLDPVKLSAYLSPRGDKLAIVAINESPLTAATLDLSLKQPAAFHATHSLVYRTTFLTDEDRFGKLGPLPPGGRIMLPPHSIATVEMVQ